MRELPLAALLLAMALPRMAAAQDSSALMNKALDERVTLILDDKLPNVLLAIWQQTGVRLREDPIIWDLLPWGPDTRIQTRELKDVRLRDALAVLTRKLGLVAVLREEFVEIQPMPALRRLPQRATLTELQALDLLASVPLELGNERPTVRQLITAVDLKLEKQTTLDLAIENRLNDAFDQDRIVYVPRNATLMDALECLPRQTRATWYPWDRSIIIRTMEDHTRELLGRTLTIRIGERGIDVLQLFREISTRTGVPFEYQPGVLQTIPPDARLVRGILENATARSILDEVCGDKGIAYTIQDDRVYISTPSSLPARDQMIGFGRIGDTELVIRESDLPPDVREYVRHLREQWIARMREQMRKEGFAPPSSQPAAQAN
jgi:hypothetical protein